MLRAITLRSGPRPLVIPDTATLQRARIITPQAVRGGVILLMLGSIPNSADPMVVWYFSFSQTCSSPNGRVSDALSNFAQLHSEMAVIKV